VPDLVVWTKIIGTDQISRIDLAAVDELVDLDGSSRFQRYVLELLLRHLDKGVGDTPYDAAAARKANIATIGVLWRVQAQ
jgi:phosphoglycolate phosphatase-like HAD superfamily hydrolase